MGLGFSTRACKNVEKWRLTHIIIFSSSLCCVLVTVSLFASLSVQSSVQREGKARQDVKVEIKMTNLDLQNLHFFDIIKMFDSQNIVDQAFPLVVLVFVLIFKTLSVFEKGELY